MDFFTRALITGALVGACCGLTGVLVLARRRVFFTQALTHATYPGAVGAAIIGIPIPVGAALAGLGLVFAMTGLDRQPRQGRQVAAGIILTGGFALGAIMQALVPNLPIDPEAFLIGSILTSRADALIVAAVTLLGVLVVFAGWGPRLLFSSADPIGYQAAGFNPARMDALALLVTTATVVAALPAVGAILMIALIAAPAQAARLMTKNLAGNLVLAPVLGMLSVFVGLHASRLTGIAAGSAIAMTAVLLFILAFGWRQALGSRGRNRVAGTASTLS
ncbi:metal ABC transporter permease [Paeniglutamicibacter sulfureus]|uniref:High-affinity zinc uptake system membrane protein ZnuB n=1 Tax=Paeniglutamicibacter sulfureus TaxID=43666 RepID=A0ABU2BP54_9MICC|nr:metal ABC transporter permease [Paeniglutamicibacter sulfureus]MDO2935176.1 metal ABC transporter permease [Paeniglutamicibacter sulfureus]MDR7359488.1 manganese/iron transport system permease protein [Paeniglutamicibacter sulfureus]